MPSQRARSAVPRRNPARNPARNQAENPLVSGAESEDDSGTASLFQNLKEDDYVLVKRRDPSNMKLVTHGKISPSDATEEYLQEQWGGGEYQLQERIAQETGGFTYGKTRTVRIAGPYKGVSEAPALSGGEPTPQPVVGTHAAGMSPGEALNTALVSQVIELIKVTRNQPTAPSVDWVGLLGSVSSLLAPVITALLAKPKNDDTDRMLQAFERMAEMFKTSVTSQTPTPANSIRDVIEAVQMMLEVKDQLGGNGGERAPSVEEKMLGYVPMLIDGLRQGKQQAETAPPSGAAPTPTPVPPTTEPVAMPAASLPIWQQILQANKPRLLHLATMDMDPEFAAEMAVNLMPPTHAGPMREFLAMPDHVEQAMAAAPELRNFPKWVGKFFAHAASLMNDDDGDDEGGHHDDTPE